MLIYRQLISRNDEPEGPSTTASGELLVKEAPPSLKSTTVAVLCDQRCYEKPCSWKELLGLNGDNGNLD